MGDGNLLGYVGVDNGGGVGVVFVVEGGVEEEGFGGGGGIWCLWYWWELWVLRDLVFEKKCLVMLRW